MVFFTQRAVLADIAQQIGRGCAKWSLRGVEEIKTDALDSAATAATIRAAHSFKTCPSKWITASIYWSIRVEVWF
jgi:hypothetical protein